MAVPTGYTYETFSEWITSQVFFEDTEGLGLKPLSGGSAEQFKDLTLKGTGSYVVGGTTFGPGFAPSVSDFLDLNMNPSPFVLEDDEVIEFENGIVVRMNPTVSVPEYQDQNAVTYGDEVMRVVVLEVPEGATITYGLKYRRKTSNASDYIPNEIFLNILGQVLGRMGYTDISSINSSNIYVFRQLAIIETIKVITQNLVSLYPLLDLQDGGTLYGGTITAQLSNLLNIEEGRLSNYLNNQEDLEDGVYNILEEGLSSNTTVGVIW